MSLKVLLKATGCCTMTSHWEEYVHFQIEILHFVINTHSFLCLQHHTNTIFIDNPAGLLQSGSISFSNSWIMHLVYSHVHTLLEQPSETIHIQKHSSAISTCNNSVGFIMYIHQFSIARISILYIHQESLFFSFSDMFWQIRSSYSEASLGHWPDRAIAKFAKNLEPSL